MSKRKVPTHPNGWKFTGAAGAYSEAAPAVKRFSINHSSVGTRYSGSASQEAKQAFWEGEGEGSEFAAWAKTAQVGDQWPANAVVYAERVE
jgi:hypothetical protein